MQQQMIRGRSPIKLWRKICHVRNALLFVHHQIFDDRQILRRRLFHQMRRRILIGPGIVHVRVNIAAYPVGFAWCPVLEWAHAHKQR